MGSVSRIVVTNDDSTANSIQSSTSATWVSKLQRLWVSLQISHSGRYSVERLLALDEYTRNTSIARVLMVCIGTPLPMAALVLLQECVPLQDPLAGWSANYGFWIRAGILGGVVAVGMTAFAIYMVPGVVVSSWQLVLLFVGQAVCYPFVGMLVAALWVFPIPFMVLTIIGLYVLLFAVLFRIIVGNRVFKQLASHRDELVLLVCFSGSQSIMAVSYAAYGVLFDHITGTNYELPVILLLPAIKLFMKNLVSLTIVHMKDMVPEAVIFTVDFFNSLYLATCMQNTSSISTVATMMTLDLTQTALSLRSLHQNTDTILSRLHEVCGETQNNDSLLPVVGLLCRDTDKFQHQTRQGILLDSCLPHKLSLEGCDLLNKLKSVPGNGARTLPRFSAPRISELRTSFRATTERSRSFVKSKPSSLNSLRYNLTKIKPTATIVKPAHSESDQSLITSQLLVNSDNRHDKILGETLDVLFRSECLLLTEYLESIIPVLYGSFIVLVVHLPNAKYHMDLVGITRDNVGDTLVNVFVYALLEFASFLILIAMMMRNCRMQALYHLAFVLETQMLLIQVKLLTWVLMSLSFRVVHFGADFTFQFGWMKSQ